MRLSLLTHRLQHADTVSTGRRADVEAPVLFRGSVQMILRQTAILYRRCRNRALNGFFWR